MEEKKNKYSYFASEDNYKLIRKYCQLLEHINSALEKDCSFITGALNLDKNKQTTVNKAVLQGMLPYMIHIDKYCISQMKKNFLCCVKKSLDSIKKGYTLDNKTIFHTAKSHFTTNEFYQAIVEYKNIYNKIMENAYIDITSIVKSKAIYGYDADEICQMAAMRVISKLKDISDKYLSVSSRADLLSRMVNCAALDYWRKVERTNSVVKKITKIDNDYNSIVQNNKEEKEKTPIMSLDTFEFNIIDSNNFEDKIINAIDNHNDTLIILRHALDITFVDNIDNAISFTLMTINEALGCERPLNGKYSLADYSNKYTYKELREIIRDAIKSLQEDDNLYISTDDLDYVLEGYDEWIQRTTNDGSISESLYRKADSKKLTGNYWRFRKRCYNQLLGQVSFQVKESTFKMSKNR